MRTPPAIRSALWVWLIAALLAGRLQLLPRVPPSAVAGLLGGLVALLFLAYRAWPAVRTWADGLELRLLVALHATRLVGIYFIHLHQQGTLPQAFALTGGVRAVVVAVLALAVALAPLAPATRLRAIAIWNVVGLMDLLLVVITALRLGPADPLTLRPLAALPLSLLPTLLVPLLLATHLLIFARLQRAVPPAPEAR